MSRQNALAICLIFLNRKVNFALEILIFVMHAQNDIINIIHTNKDRTAV